jgi:hypothetical protein
MDPATAFLFSLGAWLILTEGLMPVVGVLSTSTPTIRTNPVTETCGTSNSGPG